MSGQAPSASWSGLFGANTPAWFRALASPDVIGVVGASPNRPNIGTRILDHIVNHGYDGTLIAVHPEMDRMDERGFRWVRSLADAPAVPAAVVIAVPAKGVYGVIDEADRLGVPVAVIISSGFSEASAEGVALEDAIRRAAKERWRIRVLGPNTNGYFSRARNLIASFTLTLPYSDPRIQASTRLPPTRSIVISQSGAVMAVVANQSFSYKGSPPDISLHYGNGADVDMVDLLAALDPPEPTRIGLYLEGIDADRGPRFVSEIERLTSKGHAVALLEVGQSALGVAAIQSHTGRLGGDHAAYAAAIKSAGGFLVEDYHALCGMLGWQGKRNVSRAIVLSVSGGMAIWFADRLQKSGFVLPQPSAELTAEMRKRVPAFASVQNPVDVTGTFATDRGLLRDTLAVINASSEYDVVYLYGPPMTVKTAIAQSAIATALPEGFDSARDPSIVATFTGPLDIGDLAAPPGIMVFDDGERAVQAGEFLRHRAFPRHGNLFPLDARAARSVDEALLACKVRRPSVFSRPMTAPFTDADAILAAALLPGVAKIESPLVPHKEILGLVRLGLRDTADLRRCHADFAAILRERDIDIGLADFSVEEFVPFKWEFLVDLRRDNVFGWVFTIGLGGRAVEDMSRTVAVLAPVTVEGSEAMLRELLPVSFVRVRSLAPALSALSQLGPFLDRSGLSELEINPLVIDIRDLPVALDIVPTETSKPVL